MKSRNGEHQTNLEIGDDLTITRTTRQPAERRNQSTERSPRQRPKGNEACSAAFPCLKIPLDNPRFPLFGLRFKPESICFKLLK